MKVVKVNNKAISNYQEYERATDELKFTITIDDNDVIRKGDTVVLNQAYGRQAPAYGNESPVWSQPLLPLPEGEALVLDVYQFSCKLRPKSTFYAVQSADGGKFQKVWYREFLDAHQQAIDMPSVESSVDIISRTKHRYRYHQKRRHRWVKTYALGWMV